jgi:hypothetical protein
MDDRTDSFFHCEEQLPAKMHNPKDLFAEALGQAHTAAVGAYNQVLAGSGPGQLKQSGLGSALNWTFKSRNRFLNLVSYLLSLTKGFW